MTFLLLPWIGSGGLHVTPGSESQPWQRGACRRCLLGAVVCRCPPVFRSPRPWHTPGPSLQGQGTLERCLGECLMPGVVLARGGCQAALVGGRIAAWEYPVGSCALLLSQPSVLIGQSSGCLWADECCRVAGKTSYGHRPLGALHFMVWFFFHSLYLLNLFNNFSLERVSGCSCAL